MRGPLLAFDTSTARAYVAVLSATGEVLERVSNDSVSHNEELAILVSDALSGSGVRPSDLRGIVIGKGPGSFTGLRIGYSVAKGMAFALSVPLAEISSHHAIALGSDLPSGSIVVLGDARREEFFCSAFRVGKNCRESEELLRAHLLPISNLARLLSQFPSDEVLRVISETPLPLGFPEPLPPRAVGSGLLRAVKSEDFQVVSIEHLAAQEPEYLRAVAAKTIAERVAERTGKVP